MAFLRGLDERFEQTMDELYSGVRDVKDDAALHPIIIVSPNDPNRRQGVGQSNRLVPIQRIATDEVRMSTFLTSPRGLKFLVNQQVLQTGNSISETRLINPLFVNLNLTPNAHFNRHLFDQTDVSLGSVARSPASTVEIGLAGRLQRETSAQSLINIVGRSTGRSIISLFLGQLGGTLGGTIGIGADIGTLGIDERPELMIGPDARYYSALLREGYEPTGQRELTVLTNALEAAGAVGSIFGLANIFSGLSEGSVNPLPSQTGQMRYGVINATEAARYLPTSITPNNPILLTPTSVRISKAIRGINLLQVGFGALSLGGGTTIRRISTSLSAASDNISQIFSSGVNQISRAVPPTGDLISDLDDRKTRVIEEELAFPEDALKRRYDVDDRLAFVRDGLARQADLIQQHINVDNGSVSMNGIAGGITLEKLRAIGTERASGKDPFMNEDTAQQYFASLNIDETRPIGVTGGELAPGYYHDTLNLIGRLRGTEGVLPSEDNNGITIPTDFINVTIFDKINDRLEPFRAILEGLSETTSPEFTETRYIGRIERNIVYLGATRELGFTLYLHAWSPKELERIYDKLNFITGLAFPSKISNDGFLLPPIVELTIGDLYVNQPGYFTGISHAIEEGTSWEIEKGAQVPHTIQMALSYNIIEKESMVASSAFYGFGNSVTNTGA